jgi:CRISPR-associated endoribonuclease Cas6
MTKAPTCDDCMLRKTCPYAIIFEPYPVLKTATQTGYVIEPPTWGTRQIEAGEQLKFHIVLIGRAVEQLPLVLLTWQSIFKHGLGVNGSGKGEVIAVYHQQKDDLWEPIFGDFADTVPGNIAQHEKQLKIPRLPDSILVKIETPLRLKADNKAVSTSETLSIASFLQAIYRRYKLLMLSNELEAEPISVHSEESQITITDSLLERRDWQRYSNRQGQYMRFDGIVGSFRLSGNDLKVWWPLLYCAQFWHIGQKVSFGLGQISLTAEYDLADASQH